MTSSKFVGYCYPTSDGAKWMGRVDTGAWYVYVGASHDAQTRAYYKSAKPFATRKEALAYAETLPQPYSQWSVTP